MEAKKDHVTSESLGLNKDLHTEMDRDKTIRDQQIEEEVSINPVSLITKKERGSHLRTTEPLKLGGKISFIFRLGNL